MIPFKDGSPHIERIVQLDSTYTKEMLYSNAKRWFAQVFNDANHVIQVDDRQGGEIIGKGYLAISWKYIFPETHNQKFTISINVKDGKYRYKIYDVSYPELTYSRMYAWAVKGKKQGLCFFEGVYNANDIFVASLIQEMKKKPVAAQDW